MHPFITPSIVMCRVSYIPRPVQSTCVVGLVRITEVRICGMPHATFCIVVGLTGVYDGIEAWKIALYERYVCVLSMIVHAEERSNIGFLGRSC